MSEFQPLGPGTWEFPGEAAGDDIKRPVALFICDLQPRFNAVANFDRVVMTGAKMVKAAKILEMGIAVSEQRPEVFGAAVPELGLDDVAEHNILKFSKSKFSMLVPELEDLIAPIDARLSVVIVGIEAHICVLQTALDFLRRQAKVYVLADGVSSINKEEVPIALERIRQAGGVVTTSESFLFQVMRDSSRSEFREFAKLVKDTKQETQETLEALLPSY